MGAFIVLVIYNSRKARKNKQRTTNPQTLNAFQNATTEEREKMLESRGFTKYTDENGSNRWKPPMNFNEMEKAEKVDLVFKNDSVEMVIEKGTPKIRCQYCGTMYHLNSANAPIAEQADKVTRKLQNNSIKLYCLHYLAKSLTSLKFVFSIIERRLTQIL